MKSEKRPRWPKSVEEDLASGKTYSDLSPRTRAYLRGDVKAESESEPSGMPAVEPSVAPRRKTSASDRPAYTNQMLTEALSRLEAENDALWSFMKNLQARIAELEKENKR